MLDFLGLDEAGRDRIVGRDLAVRHAGLKRFSLAGQSVEPIRAALDVADDPDLAACGSQSRTNRPPAFLADAARFINHRGVDVLAVDVVRLLRRLEPDTRAVGQVDPLVRVVRADAIQIAEAALHAAVGDLGLHVDRSDPPKVLTRLAVHRLLGQPDQAWRRLSGLG